MGIWGRIKTRNAIRDYATQLPPILKKKYGKHKHYNAKQVRGAVKEAGLNQSCLDYANAMYCTAEVYEELVKQDSVAGDYDTLRSEIADCCFDGNDTFTCHDLFDAATKNGALYGGVDVVDSDDADLCDTDCDVDDMD